EVLHAGRRIREYAELDVPLVVMAEKYGTELEGTNVNASLSVSGNDWITYLEDHEQLKNLIARLLVKPSK
ncbi:MAG TPA: hypothetical protein VEX60_07055, partial [Pyrinomonadaceae bacterium]|nr:hypothetical protein [Pyrinomonadaceae bacterium]